MIAIDTNILVRYFTQDDPGEARLATRLIEDRLTRVDPGFVSTIVISELIWVLDRAYKLKRPEIDVIVAGLLNAEEIVVDEAAIVRRALRGSTGGLSDALIHAIGQARGCTATVTFDRAFARHDGVDLLAA